MSHDRLNCKLFTETYRLNLGMETPYCQRTCRLCDFGEVEDQHHFVIVWPTFKNCD